MDQKTKANLIKAVCAMMPDATVLQIAKWWEMSPHGRAAAHLDQYLEGKGDLQVDLAKLLQEDSAVQSKVHSEILFSLKEGKTRGTVPIPSPFFINKDWQYAVGSINVNWIFPSVLGEDKVHVGFRNEYKWHPEAQERITQCVHKAADNLRTTGSAKNYWMTGMAEVVLWLPQFGTNRSLFHIVVAGDTLSKLALKYYRDAKRWPEIRDANRSRVTNPDFLQFGTVLEIPNA